MHGAHAEPSTLESLDCRRDRRFLHLDVGFFHRVGNGADRGVARAHACARAQRRSARAASSTACSRKRDRLIGAVLLGNTLVSIGSSAFLTSVLEEIVGYSGVIYATGLMTLLLLVFAEILPKTLAINYPDRVALVVAPIIRFFVAHLRAGARRRRGLGAGLSAALRHRYERQARLAFRPRGTEEHGRSYASRRRRRSAPNATCSAACSICAISSSRT